MCHPDTQEVIERLSEGEEYPAFLSSSFLCRTRSHVHSISIHACNRKETGLLPILWTNFRFRHDKITAQNVSGHTLFPISTMYSSTCSNSMEETFQSCCRKFTQWAVTQQFCKQRLLRDTMYSGPMARTIGRIENTLFGCHPNHCSRTASSCENY